MFSNGQVLHAKNSKETYIVLSSTTLKNDIIQYEVLHTSNCETWRFFEHYDRFYWPISKAVTCERLSDMHNYCMNCYFEEEDKSV